MKWYNSVKIKLIGFFLFVSTIFLISIITVFFMMRNNNLHENASKEATLLTSKILHDIKSRQILAEEIVQTLSSVSTLFLQKGTYEPDLIKKILSGNVDHELNIVSGGVWFEPGVFQKASQDYIFFDRSKSRDFTLIKDYADKIDYHQMIFYKLGKKTPKGEVSWTEVDMDPVTKVRMMTIVSPVYDGHNRFVGVANVDIAIDNNVQRKIKSISANRYMMILDQKGNIIAKSGLLDRQLKVENIFSTENQNMLYMIAGIMNHLLEESTSARQDGPHLPAKHIKPSKDDPFKNGLLSGVDDIQSSIHIIPDDPLLNVQSILAVYHFKKTGWNVIIGIPQKEVMARQDELFYNILFITVLLTLFSTVLGYFVLKHIFIKPIEGINSQLQSAMSDNTLLVCHDKGEIGMLVENLNTRTRNLVKARERESKEHQLRLAHEEMLMQQSKMAVMGEMMDSVAHQWKQPLNALTLYCELIRNDFEEGNVDQAYVEEFRKNIQVQIDHMVNTLDEFRSFFRPNKEKKPFKMIDVVNSALFLAKDDILKNRILVKIEQEDDIEVNGYENEFKHLILNIINNAKDAFIENEIQQRLIRIRLISDKKGDRLEICDNAGGVPEKVIDKIFEANVTTKEEGKGTGIGLYMSRQIAEKHHATLSVENRKEGACFIVTFSKESQEETATPAR